MQCLGFTRGLLVFFFSTPGRFVTSPGYSSGAVATGTSSTARRPKTSKQPTNQQPSTNHQPTTNHQRTKRNNEHGQRDKQTRTDNKNPATPHTLPIAEAWRGKQEVQCLGFTRGLLVFFFYTRAFRHQSRLLVRCRGDRNQQHGTPKTNQPTNRPTDHRPPTTDHRPRTTDNHGLVRLRRLVGLRMAFGGWV